MYQRCFDNAMEPPFRTGGNTPDFHALSSAMIRHGNPGIMFTIMKPSLFMSKGVARLIIDSSLYVAHADDIVVIERGRLHAVASDANAPATTYTCALHGFRFRDREEHQLLQPHSCPVISAGQGERGD